MAMPIPYSVASTSLIGAITLRVTNVEEPPKHNELDTHLATDFHASPATK